MDEANAEVNDTARLWLHRGCPDFCPWIWVRCQHWDVFYLDVFKNYVDMISFYTLCIYCIYNNIYTYSEMFGDTLWAPPQEPNSQQLPGPVLILIHGIDIAHPEEGETREKPLWGGFMWVTQSWTHHLGFNPAFRVMLLLGVVYYWVYHSMEIWWVDNLQPTILIFESEDIMFL
jgi:hypothetical protein